MSFDVSVFRDTEALGVGLRTVRIGQETQPVLPRKVKCFGWGEANSHGLARPLLMNKRQRHSLPIETNHGYVRFGIRPLLADRPGWRCGRHELRSGWPRYAYATGSAGRVGRTRQCGAARGLVPRPIGFAMFESTHISDRFVVHPRHSKCYGCGSLRALGVRDRFSACTQTYGSGY